MKSGIKMLILGIVIGIVLTAIGLEVIKASKKYPVYEARGQITLKNGIIIPKDTTLYQVESMPEGFNVLRFDISIFRGHIDKYFSVRERKQMDDLNHWIDEKTIITGVETSN